VRVEFDPSKVSYDRLLEVFFGVHNPAQFGGQGPDRGDQYRSSVFVHGDSQRKAVEGWLTRLREKLGRPIATKVDQAGTFWMAEDYHQQYYVKNGIAACPIPTKSGGGH
jgi:peptide-methionine (S)-S-oxide reductase